jgi:uncharacterized membrane protein
MLSNSTPTSIGPFTVPKPPYDPVKQFTHVAHAGRGAGAADGQPQDRPGQPEGPAQGGRRARLQLRQRRARQIGHIVGEMIKHAMKIQMTHIPYKGGAPMTTDLIAGQIPVGIDVITAFVPMVKAGQIKALAVTTRTRTPLLPDVPTVVELGLPQLVAENYFGVSGPAGLPKEVTDKLGAAAGRRWWPTPPSSSASRNWASHRARRGGGIVRPLYLLDWANLLLRWAHVITAIAWIGSSFYFVLLDNSLTRPRPDDLLGQGRGRRAVGGARRRLLQPAEVHGGAQGAARQPALVLLGELQHLADRLRAVHGAVPVQRQHLPGRQDGVRLVAGAAVAAALGFLVAFWVVYDAICRVFGRRPRGDLIVAALVFGFVVVAASWLACQLFAGRAAFLLVGAMLATAMSANVFFWIIPGQRKVVAQTSGRPAGGPGARPARQAAQRAQHLLHAAGADRDAVQPLRLAHQGPHNWLVLVLLMLAGALIRHSFVPATRRMCGPPHALGACRRRHLLLVGLALWLAPAPQRQASRGCRQKPAASAQVQAVVQQRCVLCHNAQVQQKNVALHTPALLRSTRRPCTSRWRC